MQRWQQDGFLPLLPEGVEHLNDLLLRVTKPRKVQAQAKGQIDPRCHQGGII